MINVLNDDLQLEGKKVLLRVDFNVPINKGAISETSRIEKIIPTINFLLKKKAKIIILSHIGRPKGKLNKELSLKPISEKLGLLLNEKILFNDQKLEEISLSELNKINNGSILMLENIRFSKGEEDNDDNFSKKLSKLGDIYVNDAFSCCHRAHASIEGITKYIPSYFGFQITEEINALKKITSDIKNPVTLIIGGAKISTKIQIINNLIKKFDNIVIVGGMANTVLKYKGINIGKSICENDYEKVVKEILYNSKKYNCKVILPVDVIVAKDFKSKGKEKKLNEIDKEDLILDIGTKTISSIKEIIDKSNSILWNGPAGYFENENFQNGTKKILEIISNKTLNDKIFSIAGGGETVAAINKFKKFNSFTFVSTAGGAFLEFLEGKDLPGIKALNKNV
ncbi:MAG: phosphoglycerate kinase [Candidatus Pelagibacter sp. TMED273]|nr:MAG: phosphoglycerate kinase [Candidatus Pelagibacter sp. TMED273]|tara:strand:+ start:10197 stop:11387 length:1191 start_codon:yes stop_codon:yes gene_type:complete